MKTYNLRNGKRKLTLLAPGLEAAVLKFIDYFNISYCPEHVNLWEIEIEGHDNPFIARPFTERAACEIVELFSRAADCEVIC